MRKNNNIEMKIYEILGVKVFRKMVFGLYEIFAFTFTTKISKEERKDFLNSISTNYNIGEVKSLEDIKKFKKYLFLNAGIHISSLIVGFPFFLNVLSGTATLHSTIINLTVVVINLYCIMLQRYNNIRINKLIKRMTPRYEKQKETIKDELRECDSLCLDHTYKIVDKKSRETVIPLEELIANASLEQLKQYRELLVYFQKMNQIIQENEFSYDCELADMSIPDKNNKTLKLELKNKDTDNCTFYY